MPKRRSYSDKDIINAAKQNHSVAGVLRTLKLKPTGANYKSMHSHFSRLNINTKHFSGQGHLLGKNHNWSTKIPLCDILVEESTYTSTFHLKKRLLREGFLTNKCTICHQPPVWNGEPLVLVLDHVNGVNNDHRLENLRLVCPNCNSQLPTHAGRNKGKHISGDLKSSALIRC